MNCVVAELGKGDELFSHTTSIMTHDFPNSHAALTLKATQTTLTAIQGSENDIFK